MDPKAKNGTLGLIVTAVAIITAAIGGITSVTRPIQYQMEALEERLVRVEVRSIDALKKLDDKLQIEIKGQSDLARTHSESLRELQREAEARSKANATLIEERAGRNAEEINGLKVKVAVMEERIKGYHGEKGE